MSQQPKFTEEFKREGVELSYRTTTSQREFAQDMGVGRSTLTAWRAQMRELGEHAFPGKGHQTPQDAEITRLKRQLKQTQQERELRKALAFFAQANP